MADTQMGLASSDLEAVKTRIIGAWDAFIDLAEAADPAQPTRLHGWTVREVVLHLGRWDDHQPLEALIDSAESGDVEEPLREDKHGNDAVIASHSQAGYDEILAAIHRSRDGVQEFLSHQIVDKLATAPTASILGPLPLMTVLNAGSYELAVHANDIGRRDIQAIDFPALSSLADITGALGARQRMHFHATAQTSHGGWRVTTTADGWVVEETPPGKVKGVAVIGGASDVLDCAAGRAFGPTMLAQRKLKVQDLTGFLRLTPIVDAVPGIPGGIALRAAAKLLSGAAGVVNRLRF